MQPFCLSIAQATSVNQDNVVNEWTPRVVPNLTSLNPPAINFTGGLATVIESFGSIKKLADPVN